MARNLADAWREVPHISLFDEVDARALLAVHARLRADDATITLTAPLVRAVVLALADVPILNASLDTARDQLVHHDAVNVGVAVAGDDGLVVPVVHDAHRLDVNALGRELARVTDAGRSGHLAPELLRGATFTVTNFGTSGGRFATPIVRPPQVAILGFGAVRVRPVVDGDAVIAAPTLPVSLSADHRVVDGHDATTFVERVLALLRAPDALLAST
jgi:pyruvate/2-oxoglutarate dehydrogenase complex dihydrolipoamide acyltransferase (E2) component